MHDPNQTPNAGQEAGQVLQFAGRDLYGRRIYYPVTPAALVVCRIAGRRSLDRGQLQALADSGLAVALADPGQLDPVALQADRSPAGLARRWMAETRQAWPHAGAMYQAAHRAQTLPPTR
jgi:hypothetical protein